MDSLFDDVSLADLGIEPSEVIFLGENSGRGRLLEMEVNLVKILDPLFSCVDAGSQEEGKFWMSLLQILMVSPFSMQRTSFYLSVNFTLSLMTVKKTKRKNFEDGLKM